MKQDFIYVEIDLNNLYSWRTDHLVGDGGSMRKSSLEKWDNLVAVRGFCCSWLFVWGFFKKYYTTRKM